MFASPPITEPTTPHPPRFRWLKRLSIAGVVMLAALLLLRLWWGREARRQLDAEIAAAHGRGEPVLIADFNNVDPVPDDENAAILLKSAAGNIVMNATQNDFETRFDSDEAQSDSDRQMIAGIVRGNANALQLARRAASLTRVDWGIRLSSPVYAVLLSHLNGQRELTDLLQYSVFDHHWRGDDAQSLQDISVQYRQSEMIDRQPNFLVTHLVSIGIGAVGSRTIYRFADELKVVPGSDLHPTSGPATTAQLRALIAQILDDGNYRLAGQTTWYGERIMAVDDAAPTYLLAMPMGSPQHQWLLWPLRPMFQLDALRMFRSETTIAHAAGEPTAPAAAAKAPTIVPSRSPSPMRRITTLFTDIMMPSSGRAIVTHFRGLTDRRMAAVLLAIRLYKVEHGGAAPPNLQALVPDYLPAVPVDPFSPQAEVLRYVTTPGSEAIYSVGENGRDDGAATRPARQTNSNRRLSTWEMMDAVVPLRPPPPRPPTTEP
jgi:hypothetical protein